MTLFLGLGIAGIVLLALTLVFDGVLEGLFGGTSFLDGLFDGLLSLPVIAGFVSMLGFGGALVLGTTGLGAGPATAVGIGAGAGAGWPDLAVQPVPDAGRAVRDPARHRPRGQFGLGRHTDPGRGLRRGARVSRGPAREAGGQEPRAGGPGRRDLGRGVAVTDVGGGQAGPALRPCPSRHPYRPYHSY